MSVAFWRGFQEGWLLGRGACSQYSGEPEEPEEEQTARVVGLMFPAECGMGTKGTAVDFLRGVAGSEDWEREEG